MNALLSRKSTVLPWEEPYYMAGTEGTGEYLVLKACTAGRVGFRALPGGSVRVRVEPNPFRTPDEDLLGEFFPRSEGWKQPGDSRQDRYSKVFTGKDETVTALTGAVAAISAAQRRSSQSRRHLLVPGAVAAASAAVIYWVARQRLS